MSTEQYYCDLCGYVSKEFLCEHFTWENFQSENECSITESNIEESSSNNTIEELLISLIEVRQPLWNTRLPITDRSKGIKENLWIEIYNALGKKYSINFLQKKWRNLRDTYVKAKVEIEVYTPSGGPSKTSKKKWKHYDLLKFLSETVAPKRTATNLEIKESNPSSHSSTEDCEPHKKRAASRTNKVEAALIDAITNIAPPENPSMIANSINQICIKLSNILDTLEPRQRALLEIDLLRKAYETAYPGLYN
ncbi:hypothetical protein FQA39_LY12357 [Lamprigera yunnana]|nr:hypothetical protein FQA39_LY12357 [Lamprigera yunnana]